MIVLNRAEYRKKVLGCWMGKNIGGTVGAPFEWKRQVNDISFYVTEQKGEPLPNDDLDLQLLWLIALEERGPALDAKTLAELWLLYVAAHWSEYGVTKVNLRAGLPPPLSGSHNNPFKDSCGAMCRVDLWGCIAPGAPALAARYACEDAMLDHGDGEGTYAAVFCAALESAAFIEKDLARLVEIGLSYIPADCGVALAVRQVVEHHRAGKDWRAARDEVLRRFRGLHRPARAENVSAEDRAKGFGDGKLGYDAPSNIGMIAIGLLYGGGDFGKSLCTVVNCGEDTDTTAALVGAIFGIMHGIDAIPEKWIAPIGRSIRTLCLNLGDLSAIAVVPPDVDNLTDRTERVARRALLHHRLPIEIADKPSDLADVKAGSLLAGPLAAALYEKLGGPVYRFDFFEVCVDYGGDATVRDGVPRELRLRIKNAYSLRPSETYSIQANLNVRWLAPEGWRILPARSAQCLSWRILGDAVLAFTLQTDRFEGQVARLAVEITLDGRPQVMLVPVVFVNGNGAATPPKGPGA
jgi:ADP-ribosylglycohydrolase